MGRLNLNGQWQGTCISSDGNAMFSFPGTVPGCVHTDLMGSHIPENIYYRDHADLCQWIETCHWEYTKTFHLENIPTQAQLVFEGLDTLCTVYLNGQKIADTDNMHIKYEFAVGELLQQGENYLSVVCHPVNAYMKEKNAKARLFGATDCMEGYP